MQPRPKFRELIKHYREVSELHATVLFFVVRAFILYQAYFWWRGIKVLPSAPCEEYVWAWVHVRLQSGALRGFCRFVFLILSIGVAIDVLRFFRKSCQDGEPTLAIPKSFAQLLTRYTYWSL
jgi:hypothetical protein